LAFTTNDRHREDGVRRIALAAFLVAAFLPAPLLAQNEAARIEEAKVAGPLDDHDARPAATAALIDTRIVLDGRLDDDAWQRTSPVTRFVQTEPHDGAPATERTLVHVAYDQDALYIGARMFDSTGDVRKRLGRRDAHLSDSDWFYVMFDSYHDHLTAYQFSVNPAGVKRDEIQSAGGNGDSSWDAVWDVATSVDAEGWTAELRIPFSQLRFRPTERQQWGVQFSRRMIAKEEVTVFAFTPKSMRGGVPQYGHLEGLGSLAAGKRFEILPYSAFRAQYVDVASDDPYRDGSDFFPSAGVDLKVRVTSSLTLDATVNPDFGQVELDPATVNLTAFETSFDEKRPFFVEGADVFRFGTRLFYSRRIGRSPQGDLPDGVLHSDRPDASTILGAAKLSGRTGDWNIGFLEAVTAEERARYITAGGSGSAVVEPMTNYVAGRVERSLRGGQTQVGGIVTALNRRLAGTDLAGALRSSAYTGGADFTHEFLNRSWALNGYLAFSHILGSPEAILRAQRSSARYYQRPDADYLGIDSTRTSMQGYAGRLVLSKNAGLHWRGETNVSFTSPGFEINDVGFQTSVDRLGADLNISYVENRLGDTFRNYRLSSRTSRDWNFGWDAQGGSTSLSFNAQLLSYWGGHVTFTRSFHAYDDRFTRGGPMGVNLPDNRFDFNINSDNRKRVNGRLNGNVGWGESGAWNRNLSFSVSMRPAENWTVSAGPSLRRNRAAAQYVTSVEDITAHATFGRRYVFAPLDQTTLSMETRLNVNFTPELSLDMFAQPFISTGDYGDPMELAASRSFDFVPYAGDVGDSDFSSRSLRGNAVLRWEWKPGSTLFVVWQQRRAGELGCDDDVCGRGRFDIGRDIRALFDPRPENVFMVKMNYWLNL
jgi:hypothetical protein